MSITASQEDCLHDVQGLPHDEIAAIMDCAAGTMHSRLNDARRELQGYLSDNQTGASTS